MKKRPSGYDPYVEKHFETDEGLKYGSWNKYQGQKRIDERSIFPNEIVIDIDAETTEECRKETRKVATFLDSNGYDYKVADTGGTGFHIHLFFNYDGLEAEEYRPYRLALFDYLKAKCREEANANVELWDEQPVRFDITNGKGHLVRAFGGRKQSSNNRKTMVLPNSLDKKEVTNFEEVEYPPRIPWSLKISKTGTDKSDLSINKIQDKVEEVREKEKQVHDKEVEVDFDENIEGIEDARDIPANKVLRMLGKDFSQNQNFECPFHEDSDPSATLYKRDGVERLYCFADSCVDDSPPKVWNAIDILVEDGYNFSEALEKLEENFDIEVQIGYNPSDYFGNNIKGNYVFQPQRMAEEIMREFEFKNVNDEGFFIWDDGLWRNAEETNIIGREVDKRLKNETCAKHRNNVRDIIKNHEEIQCKRSDFETPEDKIPFNNGVYDLEKDELVEHRPEFNFDFKYEAEYRPDLTDQRVDEFISTLMPNSQDKRKKLREIAALCLIPSKINQKVPVFYGQGSNGKNQFVKILWKMLGEDCYHKTSARKLQQDSFEMASVVDKQMAFFDEFEDVTRPGQLKTLVGDEQQNIREMRKESYTAKTTVYPIFAANELPNPSDNSDGFYRRWEIIDFPQKFTSEEDDSNPDKMPPKKLEQEFMYKDAIDAFATSLIKEVKELRESHSLTAEQTTEEVRKTWKRKGNALYAFIDRYLTSGDLPDENGKGTDDWIKKDELLEVINNYMEANNNSKVKKHQLTKALDAHPDFRIWTNYRPTAKDGSRPSAYAGIKFKSRHVQDVKLFFTFNAYVSPPIGYIIESVQFLDIVDGEKTAEVLNYLNSTEEREANMVELIRNLNLSISELEDVNSCEFISVDQKLVENFRTPVYSIDVEAVKNSDSDIDFSDGKFQQPSNFLRDRMSSWSRDTVKDVQDVVEDAVENGFAEEKIEQTIERLIDDGEVYKPQPGKIQKV